MENKEFEMKAKFHQKLINIRDKVEYITKNGVNKFHKYNYVTEADVLDHIRKELSVNKISMTCNTIGQPSITERKTANGTTNVVTINLEFELIDAETGYGEKKAWYGQGEDPTDKGIYKAYTGGVKYFLLKNFLVATGDDPENDGGNKSQDKQKPENPFDDKNVPIKSKVDTIIDEIGKLTKENFGQYKTALNLKRQTKQIVLTKQEADVIRDALEKREFELSGLAE